MILSARSGGGSSPPRGSSPNGRPGTASAGHAWKPPGIRPHSPARQHNTGGGMTGTRRNRPHEHMHLFLDDPEAAPDAQGNFFWLYGAFDFKMQCPMAQAQTTVFKTIDRLVDRMNKHHNTSSEAQQQQQHIQQMMMQQQQQQQHTFGSSGKPQGAGGRLPSMMMPSNSANNSKEGTGAVPAHVHPPPLKAHLIFDIISTKKHLLAGLPYQLGTEVYDYVDKTHGVQITTTFVGLTDNTARRPGRDVYYTQSEELTKNRQPFSCLDGEHMIVVFPGTPPSKLAEGSEPPAKKSVIAGGRRAGSSATRAPSATSKRPSPPRRK